MLPKFLQPYAKAVVALLSVAAVIAMSKWGVEYPDLQSMLLALAREMALGALGSWGVYQVTNAPKE